MEKIKATVTFLLLLRELQMALYRNKAKASILTSCIDCVVEDAGGGEWDLATGEGKGFWKEFLEILSKYGLDTNLLLQDARNMYEGAPYLTAGCRITNGVDGPPSWVLKWIAEHME